MILNWLPQIVTPAAALLGIAVLSYLIGSIPFGIVITKLFGLGNLREIGSGNIGATNVLRTGNKLAAFLTLILDAGKGAIMVIIAHLIFRAGDAAQLAGFAAFLGHLFPIWLRFSGGKGVATYLGTLLALSFSVGAAACLTWLAFAALFRFSSLAALATAVGVLFWLLVFGRSDMMVLMSGLGALVWIRHSENIKRLLAGTEPRIGKKS